MRPGPVSGGRSRDAEAVPVRSTRRPARASRPRSRSASSSSGWQKTGHVAREQLLGARVEVVAVAVGDDHGVDAANDLLRGKRQRHGRVRRRGSRVFSIGGRAPTSSSIGSTRMRCPAISTITVALRTSVSRTPRFLPHARSTETLDRNFRCIRLYSAIRWRTTSPKSPLPPKKVSGSQAPTGSSSLTTTLPSRRSTRGRSCTARSCAWTRTRCSSTSATSRKASSPSPS